MSQEITRGAVGTAEERSKAVTNDRNADAVQDSQGSGKGAPCKEGGEKALTDTPESGDAESTAKTSKKDTCKKSENVTLPKTDVALDTATHDVTVGSGSESKKKTPTATKKDPDSCSRQMAPSSQGSPVSTNGHLPHDGGSEPLSMEAGASKEGSGNTHATTQENPVLPDLKGPKELNSSKQKTNEAKDSKDDSSGQKALMGQKTAEPIILDADGGKALAASQLADTNPSSPSSGPEGEGVPEFYQVIDDSPPPSAPFPHRLVTLRPGDVKALFNINVDEILGGGRFGDVHTCTEKGTGLQLVAKVMKVQDSKEKEMALNEVEVMNQLNHENLIQMYDALEMPGSIFLFLEYVEGGELFERIIDENYNLTEMDAMVFVRQICDGIFYMHQMYVLHLDLKPENIVCVSQTGHNLKIIDFGLARRYKPREKLRVSFGTPEFLAPEVVNFDEVSFPTDMWSLGVITYMMLSGLSPFLGDNDTETMNHVLSAEVDFNEEPFENVSDEAKDFITSLLIREKNGRLSASQCLRHPWLNDLAEKAKRCNRLLKSQIELRKYMMRRRWKKNFIAVTAANRFKKINSATSLATLGM